MKNYEWPLIILKFHLGKRSKLVEINKYLAKKNPYKDCLDIGTGTGALALGYQRFGERWTYVDNDEIVARQASHLLGAKIIRDLSLIKGNRFDLITIIDCFYYFDNPDKMITDLRSMLKPGGEILITLTDGDSHRAMNKLRNNTGLGIKARSFLFEESPQMFKRRLRSGGLKISYYKDFSPFLTELLLYFMDIPQKLTFHSDKSFSLLTNREKTSLSKLIFLVVTFPFVYILSLVDFPIRKFLKGYKFIVVAK